MSENTDLEGMSNIALTDRLAFVLSQIRQIEKRLALGSMVGSVALYLTEVLEAFYAELALIYDEQERREAGQYE